MTSERIQKYLKRSLPNETTLVATIAGEIAGFGAIVESINELRAVYVSARFANQGVGKALLLELEKIAFERGCIELRMDSSLTAAQFYQRHGYQELERGTHILSSGQPMACVRMVKTLTATDRDRA